METKTQFDTKLAVRLLAHLEWVNEDSSAPIEHSQDDWAQIRFPSSEAVDGFAEWGHLVIDRETGLPLGIGHCETALCAGGWVLALEGVAMKWQDNGAGFFSAQYTEDGDYVSDAATRLLGIERPETYFGASDDPDAEFWNFDGGYPKMFDTVADLDDIADSIAHYAQLTRSELDELVAAERASWEADDVRPVRG